MTSKVRPHTTEHYQDKDHLLRIWAKTAAIKLNTKKGHKTLTEAFKEMHCSQQYQQG